MKKLTILILFISQVGYAQSTIITETINEIEFEQDSIKAVFAWLANNIKYDVKKAKEIEKGAIKNSDFKTQEAYHDFLLKKVIKRKKGVCEDYSLLFNAIVSQLGYESYVIEGYTKNKKGKINRKVGHTWNVVKVNGHWKLYDPTWGAGYVVNDKKFVKSYNQAWYDIHSSEMIKTHIPFDPMWQLFNQPISYKGFENNVDTLKFSGKFNYKDLIKIHGNKNKKEQMQDQLNRSKEIGEGIRLVSKWRKMTAKQINFHEIHSQGDLLKKANKKFNSSIKHYNDYVAAKNKNFRQKKWTNEYAKQKLKKAKALMNAASKIFKGINIENKKTKNSLKKAIRQSEKLLKKIDNELKFLDKRKARSTQLLRNAN